MTFELSPGEKFALIAIDNVSREELPEEIELGEEVAIYRKPPIMGGALWREWIGSLNYAHLEDSNLVIIAKASSRTPEVLDAENQALQQKVLAVFYSILLHGIPHMDGSLDLTGANVGGEISVRHISILDHFYRAAGGRPHSVSEEDLEIAQRAARSLSAVYAGPGNFSRFKRGLHSLLRGFREELANLRLHLFIRALEALIKPEIGRTRKQFRKRGQLFIGESSTNVDLLGELFDLRSCAEHLHDWDCGLEHVEQAEREECGNFRSYQAELLASEAFLRVLLDDGLLQTFRDDAQIDTFWRLPGADRRSAWGDPVDLDAAAIQGFVSRD